MKEGSILDTFAQTVARQPDRIALRAEGDGGAGREISYGELLARASALARSLCRLPELSPSPEARGAPEARVLPEPRVALAFEDRADLVVAMWAVLEAGAAFLPLDLEMPVARLAFLLVDSGATLVLSRLGLRTHLPESAARTVCLEDLEGSPGNEAVSRRPIDPESLAYTIYTSGSTGNPKGVLVTHRGLANLIAADPLGLSPADIVLQAASPSFDASIFEIFLTLSAGATLELGGPGPSPVGAELDTRLRRQRISAAVLTPSVVATLPSGAAATLPDLSLLMVAGESCPAHLASEWARGRRLLNGYGPTEVTVCCTVAHSTEEGAVLPLGQAIRGARVEVVDAALEPLQGQGTGELLIAGEGLARGYHGRAALTAERFVPDALSGAHGARLYRSGDLVRRRSDGELELVGRTDGQVKIRGCRVEPGEIEAALGELPAVAMAAVVAQQGRLAAFVVPRGESRPSPSGLRQALALRLPPFMLPSTFTLLDELPRTVSGKVDRAELAQGSETPLAGRSPLSHRLPESLLAERLFELWGEILERSAVTLDDDFFELGGHSLHAVQLASRLREQLGLEIHPRLLFQHPTPAQLAEALGGAAGGERELAAGPVHLPRRSPLPLSAPQRQLWYLDQLHRSGDASYNMLVTLRLRRRPLDLAALKRALDALVRRHEVLRTRFVVIHGEPRQWIDAARPAPFVVVDARWMNPESWAQNLNRLTEALLRRPFDLARDGMVRAAVVIGPETLGPDDHRLILTQHHVASDGWSIGVLLRELSALVRTFRDNPQAALPWPPLAFQYADVALWQDEQLAGPRRQRLLDFWRRQLEGAPQTVELPTDRPRRAGKPAGNPGASFDFGLSLEHLNSLLALGRRRGATLFMTLLAAWGALLYRASWQRDLLCSVPFASRLHAATEGLLGFFTNLVVLRIGLADNRGVVLSFERLLAATRETCLEVFAHQDLPFIQLVEALRPEREGGRMPFVQMGFALQNAFRADGAFPELELVPAAAHTGASRFELSLSMTQEEGRLAASFEYRTDLFDRTTVARLAVGFATLVEAISLRPETPLDRLELLPPEARQELVREFGRNDQPSCLDHPLHRWVEEQIRRGPEAEAARCRGRSLSYGELGRAATRLARRLRQSGVRRGFPVGLLLDRSLELPVAFLAVLQAGGACVPLDPDHPTDRLGFMLADTGAEVVLTQAHLRSKLPASWAGTAIDLETWLAGESSQEPEAPELPPSEEPGPLDLACIVYTSGSTGQPKGVLMHHRGLVNRMLWQQHTYPLAPGDRVLQNLSIGFDAAIWQFFGPLIAGATIVLPPPGGHMDTPFLARFLVDEAVTCADFVPSVLTQLLEAATPGWAPRLRQIVSGGEALHRELADRVFATLPGARLINIYGPTETSLTIAAATAWREVSAATLPVGRPIANTQAYLLDRRGLLVPVGVVGEVYAGGEGVTHGYLNRAALTAECFLPDPFAEAPGRRLYRTGDLARLLPQGGLEFLGRADHQVKIRGVRIELGEIEGRLRQLPGVIDGVVLARTDVPGAAAGEKRLVAYVVAEPASGDEPPSAPADLRAAPADVRAAPADVRAALARQLPPAMVPGIILLLPELPLTVNGKVDRKRLPAPQGSAVTRGPLLLPRDPVEAELVAIWRRVLGLEELSVNDHFFDLGGHSLLAVKLLSEVKSWFGLTLELSELVAAGTVEEMARRLRGAQPVSAHGPLPGSLIALSGTVENATTPLLVLVHAVDGGVGAYLHLAQCLAERFGSSTPVVGFEAPGLAADSVLPAGILENYDALAAAHVEALLSHSPRGELVLCGWSTGGLLASEMTRHLEALGRPPRHLVLLDTHPTPRETEIEEQHTFFAQLVSAGIAGTHTEERRGQVFRHLVAGSSSYSSRPHHSPTLLIQANQTPAPWRERQVEACRASTQGLFEVESVAADHFGLLRPTAVFEVADRLGRLLRRDIARTELATV